MNKYEEALNKYCFKIKNEIIEEYDKKLHIAEEQSQFNSVCSQIDKYVENQFKLLVDLSSFAEDKNNELFIKVDSWHIENEKGEHVKLNYSQSDKDTFMKIADEKAEKLTKLNDVINDIRILIATIEKEGDFKDLLTTYGIIDEETGRLK